MIKNVQALRFLFIMLIVMSHIIGKTFDFGGECGVSFFFMLSGFVLSYAYGEQVTEGTFLHGKFLGRQLCKFYPLHVLTFLVMWLMDLRLGIGYEWYKLVANVLLLQSWIPDDGFFFVANCSSWFLCDLLFFYTVFVVAFRVLSSLSLRKLVLLLVAVWVVYMALAFSIPVSKVNAVLYVSPVTRLIDFCIGILCFRLYASQWGQRFSLRQQSLPPSVISIVEVVLIAVVVLSFFVYENMTLRLRCAALFWLYMPLILFVYVKTDKLKGAVTAVLHLPFMQWLGSISMEIYLTHFVVIRIVYSVMLSAGLDVATRQHPLAVVFIVMLIVMVAWLTKRYFTVPVAAWLMPKEKKTL